MSLITAGEAGEQCSQDDDGGGREQAARCGLQPYEQQAGDDGAEVIDDTAEADCPAVRKRQSKGQKEQQEQQFCTCVGLSRTKTDREGQFAGLPVGVDLWWLVR